MNLHGVTRQTFSKQLCGMLVQLVGLALGPKTAELQLKGAE